MYLLKMNLKITDILLKPFYCIVQSYFYNDEAQHYLILQSLYYTLNTLSNNEKILSWKSEGFLTEEITPSFTDNSLSPVFPQLNGMEIQNLVYYLKKAV